MYSMSFQNSSRQNFCSWPIIALLPGGDDLFHTFESPALIDQRARWDKNSVDNWEFKGNKLL